MISASLVLIFSLALFFFYLQSLCEKVLSREFPRPYSQAIVNANRLEFRRLGQAFQEDRAPADLKSVRLSLKCDFKTLTYLLKNASNFRLEYSPEERSVILYARLMFFSLAMRCLLRRRVKPTVLKLTKIFEYLANVVGERVDVVRFDNLALSRSFN